MNKIDRVAPALPLYGFIVQMQIFNDQDDFQNPVKSLNFNNFDFYNNLYYLVRDYFQLDYHAINNYLINLFLSDKKSIIIKGDYDGRFRIKLTLFPKIGAKMVNTLRDVKKLILYLDELSIGLQVFKTTVKQGGKISTLGGND